jgi:glutamate synthase (NADPH) large chain
MTGGRVVVLGPTGRNFGAGMSGGAAYVLDPNDVFPALLNREMVDIDPLSADDAKWLKSIVERHVAETGSTVAQGLLDDWAKSVGDFVKVMPQDYKRVLRAKTAAEAEGRNVDEAIMNAART